MDLSSYPPPYRQPIHQNKTRDPSQSLHQPTADSDLLLPQIDFHHLDPKELAEACRDWGMFRLVNHGVPTDLSNRLRDQIKQLFSLPFESKEANWKGPIAYFWDNPAALTPNGMVMKRSLPNLNWVEGFSVRLSQLPQLQGDDDHDPMLKSFRCLLEEYGRHMARLAHTLFDVLITNLGMDPALCAPYLSESTGYLRLYRYPPYPDPDQVSGLEAHTDSSVLSILNENVVGGLQVFKDERWIDIKPVSDTLVVNMGDMMQSFRLDRCSGKKCFMLGARELSIIWGDTPEYWSWDSYPESRFQEVAELLNVCWLEIRGKVETRVLSPRTTYAAYLVFKLAEERQGLGLVPAEVFVSFIGDGVGEVENHNVYLDEYWPSYDPWYPFLSPTVLPPPASLRQPEGQSPREREDGWMEIEMGEFFNDQGDDGEVQMCLMEVKGGHWKSGLIVEGIELRPKQSN
uniref:Fe2OG dioxygenase domain-containing protein n=1 Tax=Nelumbo nucifera TaxID=4432 RepID=A0A822Z640_NELNU|nr:TPA_asm: hypothetical protein HUJ06_007639 [Nelumbo nucifera]